MIENSHITAPDNCTSCALCANICPSNAISMCWNESGFLIPDVKEESCIHCGLCIRNCPALHPHPEPAPAEFTPKAYAAYSTHDNIRRASSSGGVFSELATTIMELGGVVYGVRWESGFHACFHRAETPDELAAFRGSKYVQAEPGHVYRQVREDLQSERPVLFSGLPCQVQALLRFMKKRPSSLITVSLACHGIPSRLLATQYLDEKQVELGCSISDWQFRDKTHGWIDYHVRTTGCNGSSTLTLKHKDDYMRLFLSDIVMKKACYTCPYSYKNGAVPTIGDIALGDFWNIRHLHPELDSFGGISCVLSLTPAGEKLLNLTETQGKIRLHEESYTIARNPTGASASPIPPIIPKQRNRALQMLRKRAPLQNLLKLSERRISFCGISLRESAPIIRALVYLKKRLTTVPRPIVGILTEELGANYGGLLQAYAMQQVVSSCGFTPYTLNHTTPPPIIRRVRQYLAHAAWRCHIIPPLPLPKRVALQAGRDFTNDFINTIPADTESQWQSHMERIPFHALIVGSDQVWNPAGKRRPMPFFYLERAPLELRQKSIAYAASFGEDFPLYHPNDEESCSRLLRDFKAVSTREHSGTELCRKRGVSATQMPDPTLLLTREHYDELIGSPGVLEQGKRILHTYLLDAKPDVHGVAAQLHMKVETVSEERAPIAVREWLRRIRDCSAMITDSFHGCVFAIIFNRPFVCLGNAARGEARFRSLLYTFGLSERHPEEYNTASAVRLLNTPIDWYRVNAILASERQRGMDFLNHNLH